MPSQSLLQIHIIDGQMNLPSFQIKESCLISCFLLFNNVFKYTSPTTQPGYSKHTKQNTCYKKVLRQHNSGYKCEGNNCQQQFTDFTLKRHRSGITKITFNK